jgi:hypothetical protein
MFNYIYSIFNLKTIHFFNSFLFILFVFFCACIYQFAYLLVYFICICIYQFAVFRLSASDLSFV